MTKKTYLAAPLLVLLAACGGSNDGSATNPTSPTQPTNVYSIDSGRVFEALKDGKVLDTQNGAVAALALDFTDGTSEVKESVVNLRLNENDAITMVLNGKSYAFTQENIVNNENTLENVGYAISDETPGSEKYIGLFSWDGNLEAVLNLENLSYSQLWEYYAIIQDENGEVRDGERGFLVVGTETKAQALGEFSTKSFGGFFTANIISKDDFRGISKRTDVRGDISLTANFVENSVVGVIDNIDLSQREFDAPAGDRIPVNGTILLGEGVINGNSFSGTASADGDLKASMDMKSFNGSFNGGFFGPGAEQISGTVMGVIENNGGGFENIIGGFTADGQ